MVVNFAMEGKEYTSDYLFSSLFFQKMTSYDRNLWLAASNAENGVDWLWMGTGKDGKDVPLNYSSWAQDEPMKKGNFVKCLISTLQDFLIVITKITRKIFPEWKEATERGFS